MPSLPTIDVVILTWNDGALLQRAVDSAHNSQGVSVRCIVVDNGSDPQAVPVLAQNDELLRLDVNAGVAAGRNLGVGLGRSPLVCFLDSDAVLHETTLAVLAGVLEADPTVALSAPVFDAQRPTDSGGVAPTFTRKLHRMLGRTSSYAEGVECNGVIDVDFVIGACQLFRRSAFRSVSGLDERYFYGPEDADFCMRLRLAGGRVVQVLDAGCEHPPRRRNRSVASLRGARHAVAVLRFLWRHRSYRSLVRHPASVSS